MVVVWAELPEADLKLKAAAVEKARKGKADEALLILEKLSKAYPSEVGLIHDRVVILSEMGSSREALSLFEKLEANKAPDYVIRAVVTACRELKETDFALKLVDTELAKDNTQVQ